MDTFTWKMLNPEGVEQTEKGTSKLSPHPADLSGKTVVLHWNGKHNGDLFLGRVGTALQEKFPGLKVIRGWEAVPYAMQISHNPDTSRKIARQLAELHPDLVVGAQGD